MKQLEKIGKYTLLQVDEDLMSPLAWSRWVKRIDDLFDAGNRFVVFSFGDGVFMASGFLGPLVSRIQKFKENDGKLVIVAPKEYQRDIFIVSSLDKIMLTFLFQRYLLS